MSKEIEYSNIRVEWLDGRESTYNKVEFEVSDTMTSIYSESVEFHIPNRNVRTIEIRDSYD